MYLTNNGDKDIADEFTFDGIASDFVVQESKGQNISPEEFVKWYYTEKKGNKMLDYLEAKFERCDIVEHYGNSWKINVSRDNYSIGFLFGLMEDVQEQYEVSEYQVAQTTLEQIFNMFATMGENDNPQARKKSIRKSKKKIQAVNNKSEIQEDTKDYEAYSPSRD